MPAAATSPASPSIASTSNSKQLERLTIFSIRVLSYSTMACTRKRAPHGIVAPSLRPPATTPHCSHPPHLNRRNVASKSRQNIRKIVERPLAPHGFDAPPRHLVVPILFPHRGGEESGALCIRWIFRFRGRCKLRFVSGRRRIGRSFSEHLGSCCAQSRDGLGRYCAG